MSWLYLFFAGLLEAGWAVGLKWSEGFTRPVPSALTVVAIIGSMALLGLALKELPVGAAYAVWVGIGVLGSTIAGAVFFGEPLTPLRVVFLVLLAVAVGGLKWTAGPG